MRKVVRKRKNSKGDLDIPFGLIFAIIAGAAILVLAIFTATKFKNIEKTSLEGETSRTLGALMSPLESSFESIKKVAITSSARTRIYTSCEINPGDLFGKQIIQTTQQAYGKWEEPKLDNIKFSNKYMFSESPFIEGKRFYIFSKPFEFPFKVGDLIYITSSEKNYCFKDADENIEEELELLNQTNLLIEDNLEKGCPENSVKICFKGKEGCDVGVYYSKISDSGYILKRGSDRMYFQGTALMFAAMLSDSATYECQVKRLINRTKILNEIYLSKESKISQELNCGGNIRGDLMIYHGFLNQYSVSSDLGVLKTLSEDLDYENDFGGKCPLW